MIYCTINPLFWIQNWIFSVVKLIYSSIYYHFWISGIVIEISSFQASVSLYSGNYGQIQRYIRIFIVICNYRKKLCMSKSHQNNNKHLSKYSFNSISEFEQYAAIQHSSKLFLIVRFPPLLPLFAIYYSLFSNAFCPFMVDFFLWPSCFTCCILPSAWYLIPVAYCLLCIAYFPIPITFYLLAIGF